MHCYRHILKLVIIMALTIELFLLKCKQMWISSNIFQQFPSPDPCEAHRPGRTLLQVMPRYPFYRRLDGPQGPYGRAVNLVPTGFWSRILELVSCRYTDWATRNSYMCVCIHMYKKQFSRHQNVHSKISLCGRAVKLQCCNCFPQINTCTTALTVYSSQNLRFVSHIYLSVLCKPELVSLASGHYPIHDRLFILFIMVISS